MAEEEAEPKEDEQPSPKKGPGVGPLILALLLIPIITLVLTEFVVVPRLKAGLGTTAPAGQEIRAERDERRNLNNAGEAEVHSLLFSDIIANLSGTMGTRFLKVSFNITSTDPHFHTMVETRRPRVMDAVLTTLSSITIQQLEAPGGRNTLRVNLISSINQAIGLDLVEELFFTDFIIQ